MVSILLASHDNLVRCAQKEVLTLCGYTVKGEASTVEEAIEKFKDMNHDFVVLDFHPEEFDVIKAIKEMQAIKNDVMIIVNSIWCSHRQTIEAMHLGVKDWIPNNFPYHPMRFMTSVDLLIGDINRMAIQECIQTKQDMNGWLKRLRDENIYGL